jgi:hypothetical protein
VRPFQQEHDMASPLVELWGMHKHKGIMNMTMSFSKLFCICWNSSKTCLLHCCWWWLSIRLHLVQGSLSKIWCASTMLPLMTAFHTWISVSKPSPIVWWWMCLSCSRGARLTHSENADKYDLVWFQFILMHLVNEFKCLLSISWDHLSLWHQILCHHSVNHMTICQALYKFW